ncbi:MAG: FMN-binding glutamate synthase family protein [Rhodospirillaceae bacterium]|nr:MAG: FMN-binding glutamate synthase family protein [Rhodospirillaceae bacterium]
MPLLRLMFAPRYIVFTAVTALTIACIVIAYWHPGILIVLPVLGGLTVLGFYDVLQEHHSILRNYPLMAHIRFLLEEIRPEIRQYFLESETDGTPFSRSNRAIVYQRAKGALDKRPFGTQLDVYAENFEWLHHSMAPTQPAKEPFRVPVGGKDCAKPYSASILNISAMSFGSLSANAIRALNKGAKMGNFAHDTGEGGVSKYHRENGGDIIWEIGSGYFGCRHPDGTFSPDRFAETAKSDFVKMIEIKLSQGAKPGHGGVLPAAKVSAEIAAARGVPMGVDCVSPSRHSAFGTPIELMKFIVELRRLSGGKPVGFKMCVGHPWEFLAICKAMTETGILPDFIVVDGAEGGTGAAPLEFVDHMGMPLRDGLMFVHNALVGIDVRGHVRIGCSGKITSAFDIARAMALGADWCNSARGFMFALGCIQAQQCHTDRCPTGVTTQDPLRQRALVVPYKSERVYQFHRSTVQALADVIAAAGLEHPGQLRPYHFSKRVSATKVLTFDQLDRFLEPGELLAGTEDSRFKEAWKLARSGSFAPSR